jgi:hypothetical protein
MQGLPTPVFLANDRTTRTAAPPPARSAVQPFSRSAVQPFSRSASSQFKKQAAEAASTILFY